MLATAIEPKPEICRQIINLLWRRPGVLVGPQIAIPHPGLTPSVNYRRTYARTGANRDPTLE